MKVHGKDDPVPADNPLRGKSRSLAFCKKAISWFMPNKIVAWNDTHQMGDPAWSIAVNNLTKAVKRKEVSKHGKMSQARHELEEEEFDQVEIMFCFSNQCWS